MEEKKHNPYVSPTENLPEFTFKAVICGIVFGVLFGAANAYLGLRAGLTISTSIPVAVMTVAIFRVFHKAGVQNSILEANLSQTIGSASSSVASGVIFTLPALFLWGLPPTLLQMTLLAMCGGLIGVLFMVPLRRFLIEKEHGLLPYPEGTACAKVLVASESKDNQANYVFWGLGLGMLFKVVFGWLKLVPSKATLKIPFIKKAQLGFDMSAALFGVGYILGPRISSIMVAGGLLSWLVIIPAIAYWGDGRMTPLYPEGTLLISQMTAKQIWHSYVRYIGAGAVAAAGFITLAKSIPTMIQSFRIGAEQLKKRLEQDGEQQLRTDQELSLKTVGGGLLVIAAVMAFVPTVFGSELSPVVRILASVLVVIFAFFFVTVSSRIVGMVGVTSNPTSGMTIATLLITSSIFLMFGWTDNVGKATALTVGCVVAIAASISGDTSQDLKTGFLMGATPRKQQLGELVGVMTSAAFVCLSVILLNEAYQFGSEELAAPQATLMKLVIEGVLESSLPWTLVGIGVVIAVIVELLKLPSLAFAVGVYLPVSTMTTVFLGGMLRKVLEKKTTPQEKEKRANRGILLGSGLVGGEGLIGVLIAGMAFTQSYLTPAGEKVKVWFFGYDWAQNIAWWAPSLFAVVIFFLLVSAFTQLCVKGK
ncbi:OPT family oligopeptide transporter [Candidatus Uabimicrobium amorphum]|uniref:Oligopeptide transporter, OPT family protein n=1 Tax=Uabimicrobium amorphum TaxID=2596890 RepID=A0A5S9IR31_UABAM|nr:oligopeptide transporter, OPT family [Candidatus Uabimicrobium amorphum]BBM85901.1 oligopeptide transporter, OPT family protein [Candidatus Uabimicrobium amorphum]